MLRHIGAICIAEDAQLISLLQWEYRLDDQQGSWLHTMAEAARDLQAYWPQQQRLHAQANPEQWIALIMTNPKAWVTKVGKLRKLIAQSNHAFASVWAMADYIKLIDSPIHDKQQGATGQGDAHVCPECQASWTTNKALQAHRTTAHGYRKEARKWAMGSFCISCGHEWHMRERQIRHLASDKGARCLASIQAFQRPLTEQEQLDMDNHQDPTWHSTTRAQDEAHDLRRRLLPKRMSGPLAPEAPLLASNSSPVRTPARHAVRVHYHLFAGSVEHRDRIKGDVQDQQDQAIVDIINDKGVNGVSQRRCVSCITQEPPSFADTGLEVQGQLLLTFEATRAWTLGENAAVTMRQAINESLREATLQTLITLGMPHSGGSSANRGRIEELAAKLDTVPVSGWEPATARGGGGSSGTGIILSILNSQDEHDKLHAAVEAKGGMLVPVRTGGLAAAEATTRRLEVAIAAGDIDQVVARVSSSWHEAVRTDVRPWGTPDASPSELNKLAHGNRIGALITRLAIACHRAGVPCIVALEAAPQDKTLVTDTPQWRWLTQAGGVRILRPTESAEGFAMLGVYYDQAREDRTLEEYVSGQVPDTVSCCEDTVQEFDMLMKWAAGGWSQACPDLTKAKTAHRAQLDQLRADADEAKRAADAEAKARDQHERQDRNLTPETFADESLDDPAVWYEPDDDDNEEDLEGRAKRPRIELTEDDSEQDPLEWGGGLSDSEEHDAPAYVRRQRAEGSPQKDLSEQDLRNIEQRRKAALLRREAAHRQPEIPSQRELTEQELQRIQQNRDVALAKRAALQAAARADEERRTLRACIAAAPSASLGSLQLLTRPAPHS